MTNASRGTCPTYDTDVITKGRAEKHNSQIVASVVRKRLDKSAEKAGTSTAARVGTDTDQTFYSKLRHFFDDDHLLLLPQTALLIAENGSFDGQFAIDGVAWHVFTTVAIAGPRPIRDINTAIAQRMVKHDLHNEKTGQPNLCLWSYYAFFNTIGIMPLSLRFWLSPEFLSYFKIDFNRNERAHHVGRYLFRYIDNLPIGRFVPK